MIAMNVKIMGAQAMLAMFKKAEKDIDTQMKKDMLKCVISVEGDAKKFFVPVKTHRLQGSIAHDVKKTSGGWGGQVGSNVTYAPYVEYGTSRMHPQPYLYPALRKNFDFIRKLLGDGVARSLAKHLRKA